MMTPVDRLLQKLRSAKKADGYIAAHQEYMQEADANAREFVAQNQINLACRDGCSFCCHQKVRARAQEIFSIAHYIQSEFSKEEQTRLISRLKKNVAALAGLSEIEHSRKNVACPLLDDSRCSVYSVRPGACRTYHSLDVKSCEYSYSHPGDVQEKRPVDVRLEAAWMEMRSMENGVFAHENFDDNAYELGAALLEALTNPTSAKRWRTHKKAFVETAHT
jgi:Fe-S-cluster containining protein